MQCNNCGTQIPEESTFCSHCGARTQQNDRSDNKTKIVVLIGVCLVAVLLIFVLFREKEPAEAEKPAEVVNKVSSVMEVADKYIQNTHAFKYDSYELVEKKESDQFASLVYNLVDSRTYGDKIWQIQVDFGRTGEDWYLKSDTNLKSFDRWKLEGEWTYQSDSQDFWIKITKCENAKISMEYKVHGVVHYNGIGTKEINDVETVSEETYDIKSYSEGFYFPNIELPKFDINIDLDKGLSVNGQTLAKSK